MICMATNAYQCTIRQLEELMVIPSISVQNERMSINNIDKVKVYNSEGELIIEYFAV